MTSPFQTALNNFGKNIKNFFSIHDNFLLLALFIAFIPFLIPQILALIIAAFGLYFQFNKSFETNELPLIMAIIIIAVVNIFLGAYIFDSIIILSLKLEILLFQFQEEFLMIIFFQMEILFKIRLWQEI